MVSCSCGAEVTAVVGFDQWYQNGGDGGMRFNGENGCALCPVNRVIHVHCLRKAPPLIRVIVADQRQGKPLLSLGRADWRVENVNGVAFTIEAVPVPPCAPVEP